MPGDSTGDSGIDRVRVALGLDDSVPVTTWRVTDLDSTRAYQLVVFGDADRSLGVAAIDAEDGKAWSWARLPGTAGHVAVGRDEASRRLDAADDDIELVWKASAGARSPLYPVWRVRGDEGRGLLEITGRWLGDLDPPTAGG